jgi:L-aminopeptidase/D-esterase-like protein
VKRENDTITLIPGITVGHAQDQAALTGCTVILFRQAAVTGVDVRGGMPATFGTTSIGATRTNERRNAVFLSGGSTFGLDVARGILRYLEERGTGWRTSHGVVPAVSGAILYDLAIGRNDVRPDAEMGYEACCAANERPVDEGSVGAGTGATVGKLLGMARAAKGGIGSTGVRLENGLIVGAIVAVNAVGNVFDLETARTIAGTRGQSGQGFVELEDLLPGLLDPAHAFPPPAGGRASNTTIGLVATNARLSHKETIKVAEMAHDGLARSIRPVHMSADGDTIFAAATGELPARHDVVGHLAAEELRKAVLRAVRRARSAGGFPGLADSPELMAGA